MNAQELKDRTMNFAIRVLRMAETLPRSVSGQTIARQLPAAARQLQPTREPRYAPQSRTDFAHKVTIVLEEADETGFGIELAERTARRNAFQKEAAPARCLPIINHPS